ncbi:MAG TPA: glycosyltransferase [Syntrophobacteraceae bacterium]|jgi:glycosyltransferase involved in cell wall biosynthesis|nr:glycosyltransferase [Syntrophobacteraceae bacterium]
MGISVVVPVYNSAACMAELLARLAVVLERSSESYEVILVNDGSHDRSWEILCQLSSQYPWVRAIDLMRNYGQHNALLCGIRAADHDIVVTMDDDLQHPPEEIPKLLAKLDEGYDVVYGTPQQEQHGLWRDMASRVTKMVLQSAMGSATARSASAFRAFRTMARNAFAGYHAPYVSVDVLLTWATTRFAAVSVIHHPRAAGPSNYTVGKLIRHAINMMTGFSTLPLQVASLLGFAFTLFGLGVLAFVVLRFLLCGSGVPGFPFLASMLAIFSGVQLFSLGIIGEYLARMHFRMMDQPPYAVRQQTSGGSGADPHEIRHRENGA